MYRYWQFNLPKKINIGKENLTFASEKFTHIHTHTYIHIYIFIYIMLQTLHIFEPFSTSIVQQDSFALKSRKK